MRVVHNVYFKLTDASEAAISKMVADCKRYLTGQPGIVFFAAGGLAKELNRPVNDQDWDVGLHLVFASEKDQTAYQTDPTHMKFIAENKANWAKVRVFDSLVD